MTALQASSYAGASMPAFAAEPAKPQKLRDVETNLLKPGVTVEAIKSAYNEWLKRIELSNPVKFREVVKKITQMQLKAGHIYETVTPAWKVAWIARETYDTIPLPQHDLLARDALQLQMDSRRNELIKYFTPEDCLEPSKETIAFVQSEVIKSLQHLLGESRMKALAWLLPKAKAIDGKSS